MQHYRGVLQRHIFATVLQLPLLLHEPLIFFDEKAIFEDVVEFHVHGSTAIVNKLLKNISKMEFTRIAEPGEFTRRALENGKMDLAQVEGLRT